MADNNERFVRVLADNKNVCLQIFSKEGEGVLLAQAVFGEADALKLIGFVTNVLIEIKGKPEVSAAIATVRVPPRKRTKHK